MPVEFELPDPIKITVTQQSPSHDGTDVVLRSELINVEVPGSQGASGTAFKHIGPNEPDTSDWEENDFWYDTSTEL